MKTVAVVLSGCGFQDGSEIHESVLTLLALDRLSVNVQCLAPDIMQNVVIDHLESSPQNEKRSVLREAARIARGHIKKISEVNTNNFNAVIFPGGYGAASTLSTFAIKDKEYSVQKDVLNFAKQMAAQKKPAGFICIAPNLIPAIYGKGIRMTIGNDANTAKTLESLGCVHVNCSVDDIVIDKVHKVITTPAYMLGPTISKVALGIDKLVKAVCDLI